jgi:phytanoyl-CoA hydroxylase
MNPGDVISLTKQTVHGSLANLSDDVRWSFDLRYNPIGQPAGRSTFTGFVARSRRAPESALRDPAEWEKLWRDTRDRLAEVEPVQFKHWSADAPACA